MPRESNQEGLSPDDLLKYPHFDEAQVIYRWRYQWYDGPINGSILYQGHRYWFDFYCDTDEPGNPFYYLVYSLGDQEVEFADQWSTENERFRLECVPLINDPATKHLPATNRLMAAWIAHEARLPDYSNREPVGWYQSGENAAFYGVQTTRV